MHKDDQMTPNERMEAFMTGKEMDRILTMPILVSVAHRVYGMTHKEKRSSALYQAEAQIACYERYGNDIMIIEYGLHGIGTAIGTEMTDPEDSVPAIQNHILRDLSDIDSLDFSKTSKEKDPWLKSNLEACEICMDKMGKEVPTGVLISGPFTAAASVYPVELILRATKKDPENLHKLLRLCTDSLKEIYADFIKTGAIIIQCDPIASGTLLRQKQYQEFVKPYATELNEVIQKAGGINTYHICGDSSKITEDMVDTGCNMLSVDNIVDLEKIKELVGDKVPILGNIDPVGILLHGDREGIHLAVKEAIRKAYDSPSGYILASGCDMTQNVPLENIEYFMEAARKYGKYPLDKNLLEI
jgi:uroporphyrinogen decarboxylase